MEQHNFWNKLVLFANRREAGKLLAEKLKQYKGKNTVIFALPRGGVVLGVEIANKLSAPLDLVIVRKIGHPSNPEYGIGAIAENGHFVLSEEIGIDKKYFERESERQRKEAQRRREVYLSGKKRVSSKGKVAILVDDGIATGLTMEAAILELKHQKPKKIIVAVPVVPQETVDRIKSKVDDFVALVIPEVFLGAIGSYYESFPQVTDEEVVELIKEVKDAKS